MPEISVIVPVYNVQEYVGECIESILRQSFTDFELILVNDGSTDASGGICNRYSRRDNRIKVIHKPNGGLSDARNAGMKSASGSFLSFIDSDDTVSAVYLEILYSILKEQGADISQGAFTQEREKFAAKPEKSRLYCFDQKAALHDYLHRRKLYVAAWAKLYKRELFEQVEFPVGKLYEDSFTTYKLISNSSKCVVSEQPVYWHRVNKDSITRSSFNPRKLAVLELPDEMRAFWKGNADEGLRKDIDYYEFRLKLSVYNRLLAQTSPDEYKKEKEELRTAILAYKGLDGNKKIKVAVMGIKYLHPVYAEVIKLAFRSAKIA